MPLLLRHAFHSLRRKGTAGFSTLVLLAAVGPLVSPVVSPAALAAPAPTGGYWMVASDGGIFSFGDAAFLGSTGSIELNQPIVGMAATPSGNGYWMVASDGGVFSFGDAAFFGSTGSMKLNRPIVGMAATPSGKGYWMVASDGGIFSFGDAQFFGSTGATKLNQPIAGMAATPTGAGYWLTASDGGVFAFGDARFQGAAPERPVRPGSTRTMVAMVPSGTGNGYWQISSAGELLAFGDAADLGGVAGLNRPLVGMAASGPGPGQAPAVTNQPPVPIEPVSTPEGPVPTTATVPWTPPQYFASAANPTWGTSPSTFDDKKAGRVLALAEVGDKVFVAGEFVGMVPPGGGPAFNRPYLVALDVNTGAPIEGWDAQVGGPGIVPDGIEDAVLALQPSADGKRLYVGGRFTSIGGGPAKRLAALDVETGRLDPTFQSPGPNSSVRAMALHGDTLFIGGSFEHVGDAGRTVAAVDATTGALRTDWVPPSNTGGRFVGQTGAISEDGRPGMIYDMVVTGDGSTLVIGGDFLHFGDQGGLLALDTATGRKTSWQPDMARPIYGLSSSPGNGNGFYAATGGTGGQAQSYIVGGAKRTPLWIAKVDGDAMDVAATTERVYLVGHYDFVLGTKTVCGKPPCLGSVDKGDLPNRHLSAFDARTGKHDRSFTANANTPQGPYQALVGANHLYVGGDFTKVNDSPQPGFVQFNRISEPGSEPPPPPVAPSSTTTTTKKK